MNKKTIIAAFTVCIMSASISNAMPTGWNQYFGLRIAPGIMNNDLEMDSVYATGGLLRYRGEFDSDMSEFSLGGKIAYGIAAPIKYGTIRGEIELGGVLETKSDASGNIMYVPTPVNANYDVKTSAYSAMLNVYFDWNIGMKLTPYISAGAGYAWLRRDMTMDITPNGAATTSVSRDDNAGNLVFQLGIGVSYAFTNSFIMDAGYRFTDYGGIDSEFIITTPEQVYAEADSDIYSHEILIGMRYIF